MPAAPTEAENYKLMFSIISHVQSPTVDWQLVAADMGLPTPASAQKRWTKLKKRQGLGTAISTPKRAATGGAKRVPKPKGALKRSAIEMEYDEAEAEVEAEERSGGDARVGKKTKRDSSDDGSGTQEVCGQNGGEDMEDDGENFEVKQQPEESEEDFHVDAGEEDDYAAEQYGKFYDGYPDV